MKFIKKMATNIFVYWSEGLRGGRHLTVIVETGGGATKVAHRAGHLINFFQSRWFARGFVQEFARVMMLAGRIDPYITNYLIRLEFKFHNVVA